MMSETEADYEAGAKVYQGQFGTHPPDKNPLKGGSDGGRFDGMDPWQQTVEVRLGQLHDDNRKLLALGIAATAFLLLAFSGGVAWLTGKADANTQTLATKLDAVVEKTSAVSERVARLEAVQSAKPDKQP